MSPFKRPLNEKPLLQRTSKQRSRVDEWVEEQQGLGQNVQSVNTEMLPSQSPRIEQGKINESVPKLVISTREQGSQVEEEISEPLRKFVVKMVEERIKLPSMAREIQAEEKEAIGMGKRIMKLPKYMPINLSPSYTTEVRRLEGNEELKNGSYLRKEEILTGVRTEVIYSQKNVSDEERMKRLSIPGPVNLGHLPPPRIPKEDEYR